MPLPGFEPAVLNQLHLFKDNGFTDRRGERETNFDLLYISYEMPRVRFELTLSFENSDLNAAGLPIPPPGHNDN